MTPGDMNFILARIYELKIDALDDDVDYRIDSENSLVEFLKECDFKDRPSIVLLDNGNLRASWYIGSQSRFTLQFLGDATIRYVLLTKYPPVYGICKVNEVMEIIKKNNLEYLINN